MTRLEQTIRNIIRMREQKEQRQQSQLRTEHEAAEIRRQYLEEFDARYLRIGSIGDAQCELISWMDQQEIIDAHGEIKTGAEFYEHIIQQARSTYISLRKEGQESGAAFDKATYGLISWIEGSQEGEKGTIFINYDSRTLHRMRKQAEY